MVTTEEKENVDYIYILNYIYSQSDPVVYIDTKDLGELLSIPKERVKEILEDHEEAGNIKLRTTITRRLEAQKTPTGHEIVEGMKMSFDDYHNWVLLYLFRDTSSGFVMFDLITASRCLNVAPQYIKQIVEELIRSDYFENRAGLGGKIRLKFTISGLQSYNKLLQEWKKDKQAEPEVTVQAAPTTQTIQTENSVIEIFISHSSVDKDKAAALIDMLRDAMNIPKSAIRCTSVPGYKLKTGAETDGELRREITDCKLFIAMLTADSMKSSYVLFELGARWLTGKSFMPIICDTSGTKLLQAPLSKINTKIAIEGGELHQFVEDVSELLGRTLEKPSHWTKPLEHFKALCEMHMPLPG